MKLYIICFLLLAMFNECDDGYETVDVYFENNSDEQVTVLALWMGDDFSIHQPNWMSEWPNWVRTVMPNEKIIMSRVVYAEPDNYQLLIWKQSTLDKYSKEEILWKNIYDKRYRYTKSELKKINLTIVYDGK